MSQPEDNKLPKLCDKNFFLPYAPVSLEKPKHSVSLRSFFCQSHGNKQEHQPQTAFGIYSCGFGLPRSRSFPNGALLLTFRHRFHQVGLKVKSEKAYVITSEGITLKKGRPVRVTHLGPQD